jgi:hypothetical protein
MQNSSIALTDTASQIAELQRRQKLAEALSAQGAAPIEVQSYKGIQAPISPFSALAKVLQTYMGAKQAADAIKGEKEARKTAREEAASYIENLGKTPDISRFETPVSVEEARQQAAVPALTPVAPAGPPEMMQVGGVPDMQGNATPTATVQAPMPQVYNNAQPSTYAGPQATVMPGRETTPQERMASLLQAGMSGNPILEQMAPAMYSKIEGQIEAQGKADKLKAQIAAMTGLTDEQKSAYAQIVDVNPQAAGNFLKDILTPKEVKRADYSQIRAEAFGRKQRGEPSLPGDDVLLYGARVGAPIRASGGNTVRATGQGSGQPTPKPNGKQTQAEQQGGFLANTILNSAKTISDVIKNDPSAGNVGFLEAAGGAIPFVGETTQKLAQSGNRQVVSSAQDEIIDAALTLATGAAYTKEQIKQKRDFYKPNITDKPETKAIKIQRIGQLIQTAKTRAGSTWTPEMDTAVSNLFKPAPTTSAKSAVVQPNGKQQLSNDDLVNQYLPKPGKK